MANDPLRIIEEYLSPEVREQAVRRNAVVALAVVGSEESTARLNGLALDDEDPGVRQKAEQEIAALPSELRDSVWRRGVGALAERGTRRAAYSLLGRLRCRGLEPVRPAGVGKAQLSAAVSTLGMGVEGPSWRFRWRPALLALVGSLVGGLVFAVLLRGLVGVACEGWNLALLLLAAPFVSWLAALGVSQTLNPILLHYDRALGGLVEVVRTALASAISGLIFLVVYWLVTSEDWNGGATAIALFLFLGTTAAAVRLGSILGAVGFRTPRGRAIGSFTSAAILGWVACAALTLLAHRLEIPASLERALDKSWLVSTAAVAGFAFLFARFDRLSPVEEQSGVAMARAVSLALGLVPVSVLGLLIWPKERPRPADVTLNVEPDQRVVIREIPVQLGFKLSRPSILKVEVGTGKIPNSRLEIRRELDLPFSVDAHQALSTSLEPGTYKLSVRRETERERGSEDPPYLFTAYVNHLGRRLPPALAPLARMRLEEQARLDLRFIDPGAGSCVMSAVGPVRVGDWVGLRGYMDGVASGRGTVSHRVTRLDYTQRLLFFPPSAAKGEEAGEEGQNAHFVTHVLSTAGTFRALESAERGRFPHLETDNPVRLRAGAEPHFASPGQSLPRNGEKLNLEALFSQGTRSFAGVTWESPTCLSCCATFAVEDVEPYGASSASAPPPKSPRR